MRLKRMICVVFTCFLIGEIFFLPVNAAERENTALEMYAVSPRATERMDFTVSANSTVGMSTSFSLGAGEKVTINATYTPASSSVDFGLVDSNGKFYFFTITDGNINETIRIKESGSYTLQVRNNSSDDVKVSGYVKY